MTALEPAIDESGESFKHLAAARMLTDLIVWARQEIIHRWDGFGALDEHAALGHLWDFVRTTALECLREKPKDQVASDFLEATATFDRRAGDPLDRGWVISSKEAAQRFRLINDYLYSSGLLSLREAERTSPTNFLSEKEKRGV